MNYLKWIRPIGLLLVLLGLQACGQSSPVSWNQLNRDKTPTSLSNNVTPLSKETTVLQTTLYVYKNLLQDRTLENQERATLLYDRAQQHARKTIVNANDFNQLAQLEMLHLGWSKGDKQPGYAQQSTNRSSAFDTTLAQWRGSTSMQPKSSGVMMVYSPEQIQYNIDLLQDLCLTATNRFFKPFQIYSTLRIPVEFGLGANGKAHHQRTYFLTRTREVHGNMPGNERMVNSRRLTTCFISVRFLC